jgi:hypothetical protein
MPNEVDQSQRTASYSVPSFPAYSPAYQRAEDQTQKLSTTVNAGKIHLEELQESLKEEGVIHEPLHKDMKTAEAKVFRLVQELGRQGVEIDFKPGQQEHKAGLIFRRPKFRVKTRVDTLALKQKIERARREFDEYKDKWNSHAGSNARLDKMSRDIEKQQKNINKTATLLEKAQQALAKSSAAAAKLSAREARAKTPGYLDVRRQLEIQREKDKASLLAAQKALRAARETEKADKLKLQQEKREKKEKAEQERARQEAVWTEQATRQASQRIAAKEARKEAEARNREKIKIAEQRKERKERDTLAGIAAFRRPEVHVSRYRRRGPR